MSRIVGREPCPGCGAENDVTLGSSGKLFLHCLACKLPSEKVGTRVFFSEKASRERLALIEDEGSGNEDRGSVQAGEARPGGEAAGGGKDDGGDDGDDGDDGGAGLWFE